MGYLDRHPPSLLPAGRPMGGGDFIWLAALGCAARRPIDTEAICQAIETISAGQWCPSGQLVCDCLDEMVRAGHLAVRGEGTDPLFTITPAGHEVLSLMLSLPLNRPGAPFGQVGLRLKLAFLDLVDLTERQRHLESLICLYESELERRGESCADCPATGCFGRIWRNHDLEHLRRDLVMLRRLAGFITEPITCPAGSFAAPK
jgi:DNA-binding PadR family transcriptional regulator